MALFVPPVGPPALVPLYFQWYIFYFAVQRKQWVVSQLHGGQRGASPGCRDEFQCQIYWEELWSCVCLQQRMWLWIWCLPKGVFHTAFVKDPLGNKRCSLFCVLGFSLLGYSLDPEENVGLQSMSCLVFALCWAHRTRLIPEHRNGWCQVAL